MWVQNRHEQGQSGRRDTIEDSCAPATRGDDGTCNHLDIAGGVAGKSSYNIVAGSVDVQVLPEELDEKVAKLHLHLCAPLLATCPSRCRVHSGTRYWRRSISSRKELDVMLTRCQKFFTR